MKKEYKKPEIMFEDFSLNTNIAGNCENLVNNPQQGTCAVITSGGFAVFDGDVPECVYTAQQLGINAEDGFCYHIPVEYNNLFNS